MKKYEIVGSLFWLGAGLLLTILSAAYPIGSVTQPGAGFLPLGLGILLVVFSIMLLAKAFAISTQSEKKEAGKGTPIFPVRARKVFIAVAVLVASVFFFERAGYIITFFCLGVCLTILTGWMKWKGSLIFAVLSVIGIYIIFVWLLKQPLPTGFLGV